MTYSRQHNWLHHPLKVTSCSYLDTGHIYTYSDGEVHCMVVIFGICNTGCTCGIVASTDD